VTTEDHKTVTTVQLLQTFHYHVRYYYLYPFLRILLSLWWEATRFRFICSH